MCVCVCVFACVCVCNPIYLWNRFTDIFYEKHGGCNTDIPVKIISDTEIDKNDVWQPRENIRPAIPYLRRCGVEFRDLSAEQKAAIESYIQSQT